MVINLSHRLSEVAKYVETGKRVADIGSDHAFLPSYLVVNKIAPYVIAGELNTGPYQVAKNQISGLKLNPFVDVRKGNGLSVIQAGEVDIITIAGMGGGLIVDILEEGKEKLRGIERLILQPNVGEELVRRWLDVNKWNLIAEEILEEDDKIYEIIIAEPRKSDQEIDPAYDAQSKNKNFLYKFGPHLLKQKSEVLIKKWKLEKGKKEYVIAQLNKSKSIEEIKHKKKEMVEEIKWITEVLNCLEKDRM